MKIQYASDLHIEFPENWNYIKQNPLKPVGDILVLAGDIVPFVVMDKFKDFFSYVSDHFESTYWIPGNHEYYYSNLADRSGYFHEKISGNVHLLNNTIINNLGVDLIFSTLWSQISYTNQWTIERGMNDFHLIKYLGHRFTAEQYNQLHLESLSFLQQALGDKANKSVVVSHHLPTFMNYPEKYKSSKLNEAFAVELFDFIEANGPDVWIYGHTHGNTEDLSIADSKIVTNQLGYVGSNEHKDFINDKYFEIT